MARRVFLGCEAPLLARAAAWIVREHASGGAGLLVATPGAGAARALRAELARQAKPDWHPPRVLTQGELTDALVRTDRPVASRAARTLAWATALRGLSKARRDALALPDPDATGFAAELALASRVRTLHAELAQEGLGFEAVARTASLPKAERARFEALAAAQTAWRKLIADAGLADPHETRFEAIGAGRVDARSRAVLVGIADANRLLRSALEALGERATALVFAADSQAAEFDALGCLVPAAWKDRDLELPIERWHVVEGPDEQAACALDRLAHDAARFAPEQIVLGVLDEEVAPHLERRLAEHGITARHAAGTPLARTRPLVLARELARFLDVPSFARAAALARHPDVERALRAHGLGASIDPAAALDACHAEHLPARADAPFPGATTERNEAEAVRVALVALCGELAQDSPRPLAGWIAPLVVCFDRVYGARELDPAHEPDRLLAEALERIGTALAEARALAPAFALGELRASQALQWLEHELAGEAVPPAASAPATRAIELAGWLELALDPAPRVVVTGFEEGRVPQADRDDAFLPDSLRRALGIAASDERIARDAWACWLLVNSKHTVDFVSARRSRAGDPLHASRFAFHVPPASVPERVRRFLTARDTPEAPPSGAHKVYVLPRLAVAPPVTSMSATEFREYLQSPYLHYLRRVLELEGVDDSEREMDALRFGSLGHDVLEDFGKGAESGSQDEVAIVRFLRGALDRRARERFGDAPLPAVQVQIEQLRQRLGRFAAWQAEWRGGGWRIEHCEWKASRALELGDGTSIEIHGKIDRIDVNEARGEWAILDYKTSAKAATPQEAHRCRAAPGWKDLQLPLYAFLARDLGIRGRQRLGYVCLDQGQDPVGAKFADWSEEELDAALEVARDVARRVRAGEHFTLGRLPDDELVLAISGRGLVGATAVGSGDEPAAGDEDGGEGGEGA